MARGTLRVLLFEYVTGGGFAPRSLPRALAHEGEAMLAALLRDFTALTSVELIVPRDWRLPLPPLLPPRTVWRRVGRADDLHDLLRDALARADLFWPIAPETGGILFDLCRLAEACGKPLLGSSSGAVGLATSKLATAERLRGCGLPVVPTEPVAAVPPWDWPVVVKPDDGCGGEGARLIDDAAAWRRWQATAGDGPWIVQPYVSGAALSLSLLVAGGEARLLCCNRQLIALEAGSFVLHGCSVNAIIDASGKFRRLGSEIAAACPELWGYIGVDLILTEDGPRILEINPRLTTSAAGLWEALGVNLAALVLDLYRGARLANEASPGGRVAEIRLRS